MQNPQRYKFTQSPLYRLGTKSKLAEILNTEIKVLLNLAKHPPYKSFKLKKGDKIREIDQPRWKLRKVQNRIKNLLSRIETPDWLFSGKKGTSYIDNAKFHQNSKYLLNCDMKSFYQNCTRERIFQIFKYTFMTSDDIAWILSSLLAFKNRIPTGSPSSQIIAFWAYYPTFFKINNLVMNKNSKISLYVDDISVSSDYPISRQMALMIKEELEKVGHTLKASKTKIYGKKDFKIITGVAISPDMELKVPNKRRLKILQTQNILKNKENQENGEKSLLGQIQSAKMIEPNFRG